MTPFSSKSKDLVLENELIGNILKGISPDVQDHGKIFCLVLPAKAGF
jgi:hypothetical protein